MKTYGMLMSLLNLSLNLSIYINMKKHVYAYSQREFDKIVESLIWNNGGELPKTIRFISITDRPVEHFIKKHPQFENLEFQDIGMPVDFDYDEVYKWPYDIKMFNVANYHAMDFVQAMQLEQFIDRAMADDTVTSIFIHCHAGQSRSQGVVRYILDTYGKEHEIVTNAANPCHTPNMHVVAMLRRARYAKEKQKEELSR